jgi:hypothetical protein
MVTKKCCLHPKNGRFLTQYLIFLAVPLREGKPPIQYCKAMDEGNIKTQNPKCRRHWCLIEFIDWRYSQSCWYFRPLLWIVASLPSLWPVLPSPLPKVNVQYIQTVCVCRGGGGGGGLLSCVIDHTVFCRSLTLWFGPDSEPTKLLHHPKQKHQ